MIITDLYQTKITVYSNSNYSTVSNNINIDGTAYIKVKLIDFNGAAVSGKSVTIKYDESTVVATGTTNSNGEFTASYTCTEWGIHSFSANNTNTQINVQAIQVQYIHTTTKSCSSLYSQDFTATVKAKPTGYDHMFVPMSSYRSVTRLSELNGTTANFQVTNINSSTQNIAAVGWLIYFPNNFYI